jgi:hypothetical protein
MSLRRPYQIRRRAPGAWVAGRWVPGAPGEAETIRASVQPATLSDYDLMQALPEGRRVESMVRVYTDVQVQVAGNEDPVASGDLLDLPQGEYVFVAVSPWQSGIISHFRYLAARVPVERRVNGIA